MTTWKIAGAREHQHRWLFPAMLLAGLGVAAPAAHAQGQAAAPAAADPAAADPAAADPAATDPAATDQMPAEAPATAPAESAAEMPASYTDWFNKMMDQSHKPFEFHGYFRGGFGINGKGGDQEAFQAPTAPAKYRLGNETESYGELIFVNNWLNPERDTDKAWFKTELLLTFVAFQNQNFDADIFTIREAFAMAGNVLEAHPEVKFWAGQRYYLRHDIHINDFYHFSESGYGGGIEDIDMGFGKMAIAYLGNSDPAGVPTEFGRSVENNVEARIYDFEVPGGTGVAAVKLSYQRGEDDAIVGSEDVVGFLVSLFHIHPGFMGGYNKFSVQFGYGGSSDIESPLFYKAPTAALKDSMQLLVADSMQINLADNIPAMAAVIFRWRDNGDDTTDTWISAGFRPYYFFSKYTAIAAEIGFDNTGGDALSGNLFKFTIAPTIKAGQGFWTRPEIRAYATAAFWSGDYEGLVGGAPYANDSLGLAFGVQAENWW